MQKQKRGFLLFICSLIPGAGEMYMGFFKQGISIMTLFWAIIAIAGGLNIASLVILLPIIWFYSFFHVHNLKEMPEEEFYALEDNYILHLDRVFQNTEKITQRQQKIAAVILIIFGIAMLWNSLRDMLFWILPDAQVYIIQDIMYQLPSVIIGILIIVAGYQILTGKIKTLSSEAVPDNPKRMQEHPWQKKPLHQSDNNHAAKTNINYDSVAEPLPAPAANSATESTTASDTDSAVNSEAAPDNNSVQ